MKQEIIRMLHSGNYACVIANHGEIRTFTRKGVADLYDLALHDQAFLQGALLADKVIGKGAAALIVKSQMAEVYTDVISRPALELLRQYGIPVEYGTLTEHIINRSGTDWCPVEKRCHPESDVDRMVARIGEFLHERTSQTVPDKR